MSGDGLELCTDGFHSDECPGCGLTADERDDPAFEVIGAMNFGDGVAAERTRIAEAVRGLDDDCHSRSGLRCDLDDQGRCSSINRTAVLAIMDAS